MIPADEMAGKLRAAVAARTDPDLLLIARTDARAAEGFEAAIDRGRRYRDAGADMLFIEALQSEAEVEATAEAFPGVPLLFNWADGGRTPPIGIERLTELGYRLVIFPISPLLAATQAIQHVTGQIAANRTPIDAGLPGLAEFTEIIGLPEIVELGKRFEHG